MDVDLSERHVAGVDECVRLSGRDEDDVAGPHSHFLLTDDGGRLPLLDDEDLFVRVRVQRGSLPRLCADEDDADADVSVRFADELMGKVAPRELVLPEDLHVAHPFRAGVKAAARASRGTPRVA